MEAEDFLKEHLKQDCGHNFGVTDETYIDDVVTAWMNDKGNSRHRYDELGEYLPDARKVLDMASGCGTFVFYGLMNGYDAYGIEPESWKQEFNRLKAEHYGYPDDWMGHFHNGVGEGLPFPDNFFEAVSTYQTMEHVQDPYKAITEMIRVTRPGGGIHICCPDYRSTYEPHYLLPWLPLFPKGIARWYLRILGRPTEGLESLQYTTKKRMVGWLKKAGNEHHAQLSILDLNREAFAAAMRRKGLPLVPGSFCAYRMLAFTRKVFTGEMSVALFVKVVSK